LEKLWGATQAVYDAGEALRIEQDEVDITIDTDRPVGVVSVADLHTGAESVDPKRVCGLVNSLGEVDGLYVAWNADLIEGAVMGNPESMKMIQAVRVKWQRLMVLDLVSRVPNSIAVTCGQHEFFGYRAADFDFAEEVAKELEVPYLGTGGTIHALIGETQYSIGLWHKYRGQSIYDATAGAKKLCAEHGPFDCTFVADKHAPAVSSEIRHGGLRRIFARGGTASLNCEYAKSLGYTDSTFNFPLVIFWPHERKMWAWDDLREGLEYLKFLRQ